MIDGMMHAVKFALKSVLFSLLSIIKFNNGMNTNNKINLLLERHQLHSYIYKKNRLIKILFLLLIFRIKY